MEQKARAWCLYACERRNVSQITFKLQLAYFPLTSTSRRKLIMFVKCTFMYLACYKQVSDAIILTTGSEHIAYMCFVSFNMSFLLR